MNVSFVGCGGMAMHYLGVYRDLPWVRVLSCIDADPASAQRAADTFPGEKPLATTDYAAALAPDVDAVIISTPNSCHAVQAISAMDAGKHVLLQKPVAANMADAEAIAAAAERARGTVGLYMSYFEQPRIAALREMVASGKLGHVVHGYARLMHRGGMTWSNEALEGKKTWRGSVTETGGGCFIQLAVHYIHIFEWATGARVTRVTGLTNRLHCPGLEGEDIACALLQLDSGAIITLDTAWCADGEELVLHGTAGTELLTAADLKPLSFADIHNPLNQHVQFLEAARDGKAAPVSIASGVRDMRIVHAVYESALTGQVAEIKVAEIKVAEIKVAEVKS